MRREDIVSENISRKHKKHFREGQSFIIGRREEIVSDLQRRILLHYCEKRRSYQRTFQENIKKNILEKNNPSLLREDKIVSEKDISSLL